MSFGRDEQPKGLQMKGEGLRSVAFRREREASWRELAELCERIEKQGVRSLAPGELARLPGLYRATLSSLSVARSISLDKNVVEYLEALSARAYFAAYGVRRGLGAAIGDFVRHKLPASARALAGHVGLAAALLVLGAVVGFVLVSRDPAEFYTLVSEAYAQGRGPASSTAELREVLYHDGGEGSLASFASYLFSNNARIGLLAFALGFVGGVPTIVLLIYNGLVVGAFAGLYGGRGLSLELWAWLLPHGVTELLAVVLCGGAGLALGHALLFPGARTRVDELAVRGRTAGTLALGAVALFFCAGLIEGVFRQQVQSVPVRYFVAGATAVAWVFYFVVRRAR